MRYVQLRAFHYVAICGGFSRAAEELFLTQPAISDQVRKLEEEYDILLFNRHKKQVTLTPEGDRLLEITRRLFDSEQQARELLSESRVMRAGKLRIMADSAQHVLHILARFRERYPGVAIEIRAGNTDNVIDQLFSYQADIGVLGEIPTGRDFETVLLNSTPISAFVCRSHPLADRTSLRFKDLTDIPLVMRERGSRTRQKLEEAASAAGYELLPTIVAEGREAVREIVASGAGLGFVSVAEFGEDSRLIRIPLENEGQMMMEEALICLRERRGGKLISALLAIAQEFSAVQD
ncbi:LysR substrate-binding domain-containing protein [Puniceibacterium sp. IMCC21224]|uniref:LysR substrate-binding domain-containing protein n=1 Tax=Puniceibacterium sp. IMCC21224 TaxID=1618204 RepID=UPI00064DAA80|nr:LysR substrate-binding domain-containing protein [Puniceibacterium sp. IMCC21224]KMK66697.1 aminoethylphosphonate catabolism associated LysR family transcriptional regulator [Puniceibacterium sp. IMCC21224]